MEVEVNPTFPKAPKEWLYQFLVEAREDEIGAVQALRDRFQQSR